MEDKAKRNLRLFEKILKSGGKNNYRLAITKNLPHRTVMQLNCNWQEEKKIGKLEQELMQDPFQEPKYVIPKEDYTRVEKVELQPFEPHIRP